MAHQISGTFEVKMTPQEASDESGITVMTLDKRFYGSLEGISSGFMLAAHTAVDGSAGYVAIERVVGEVDGRRGSFILQHSGLMDRNQPSLTITIIPDSATDNLKGLSGTMEINIIEGQHHYTLNYELDV